MEALNQKVYNFLTTIPKWKVATYKYIATKFNSHPRAIWKILNSNKDPDKFPCYKVVWFDWKLTWYALWLDKKRQLLTQDWIEIKNWKVLEKYILR